jgi:hypothetical protein
MRVNNFLELYDIAFSSPSDGLEYPNTDDDQTLKNLCPAQEPLQRLLDELVIYNNNLSFFQHQPTEIAALLQQIRQASTSNERLQLICEHYGKHLDWVIEQFETKRDQFLNKWQRWKFLPTPLRRLLLRPNRDYLLLLSQHLKDLKAAREGSGYHALTAELKILAGYALCGKKYLEPFPLYDRDPGTTNRAVKPPDNNLIMYVSGFGSDWQAAVREGFMVGYKLGYKLSDVYVFSYATASRHPLRLSEVIDRSGVFVGDARLLTDLESSIAQANNSADKTRFEAERDALLARIDTLSYKDGRKLREWIFSSLDNYQSNLYDKAECLAAQLHSIKDNLPQDQKDRKVNLVGTSQGAAILGGFLLQQNRARNGYLMDEELNTFLNKYVLNIGAHGGAFLAELKIIAGQTGWLIGTILNLLNLLTRWFPQLEPVRNARLIFLGQATQDLAISSNYIVANYTALDPRISLAETKKRLEGHDGLEIYNANDDVTTSLPLLPLPSTTEVRMMPGRHGVMAAGTGEGVYAACNKYIYQHLAGAGPNDRRPSLESDQLVYCGYIKKGLCDIPLKVDKLNLPAALAWLKPLLDSERFQTSIIPFMSGQTGVIDYSVEEEMYKLLELELKRTKPPYWPTIRFNPFKP